MDSISFITSPLNVARAASALDQIVSCAGWLRLFVVKKSIQGKRVHWTRFLIRSCSAGCLIRSGCVCTWSNRVSDGALDQIMFVVFAMKKKYTRKTSSTNSFSLYGRRVQRTRLPCMEDEFVELVFHVWRTSSMNSFFLVYFFNTDIGKITKSSSSNSILTQKSTILDSNC